MSLKYTIGFGLITWLLVSWLNLVAVMPQWAKFDLWLYTVLIIGVLGFVLAKLARPKKLFTGLLYGIIWIAIALLMDVILRSLLPLFFSGSAELDASIFTYAAIWLEYSIFFIGVVIGSLISSMKAQGLDKKPTKKPKEQEPLEEISAGGPPSPMR